MEAGGPGAIPARFLSAESQRHGVACRPVASLSWRAHGPKEYTMARISRLALLALACMAVLTACNTVKGFGKDVKKVGEQVEEKASK